MFIQPEYYLADLYGNNLEVFKVFKITFVKNKLCYI